MSDLTSEPRAITVTRWVCPHCHRGRARKAAIVEHMARCWRNAAARSCFTCRHFEQVAPEPDVGIFDGYERCQAGVDLPERGLPVHCDHWMDAEA